MKTLIDKINHFERHTAGTVASFNEVFTSKLEGLDPSLEVEIGELADTDTTRFLTVGSLIVKHNFTPVKDLIEVTENGRYSTESDTDTVYRESKNKKWR